MICFTFISHYYRIENCHFYPEIRALIRSNPIVFTAHLFPFIFGKEIQEEEKSEQITQFRNNKGIFCPGTNSLWRAIFCKGRPLNFKSCLLIGHSSLFVIIVLVDNPAFFHNLRFRCYRKKNFHEVHIRRHCKIWFFKRHSLANKQWVSVPPPRNVTMQILIELHSPDLFLRLLYNGDMGE